MQNIYFINEINKIAKENKKMLVKMSEEEYKQNINDAVTDFLKTSCNIILLAGPSSSGKTTTSKILAKTLKKCGKKTFVISFDDFYLDRDNMPKLPSGAPDLETVDSFDIDYFNKFIFELETNGTGFLPTYDFITGSRSGFVQVYMPKNSVIIIEGLHALNPKLLQKEFDAYKIYISVNSGFGSEENVVADNFTVRLMRRIIRDYYTRGKSIKGTVESFEDVRDGERLYIDPYKDDVNFIIDSTHMCELNMQAYHLLNLLDDEECLKPLKETLQKFEKISKKYLSKDSVLHEFFVSKK